MSCQPTLSFSAIIKIQTKQRREYAQEQFFIIILEASGPALPPTFFYF